MSKNTKISLKDLLNESFGVWGIATHAHPNRKRLQEAEPGMGAPTVPVPAPSKPAVQTPKQQPRVTAVPKQKTINTDVPEEPQTKPAPEVNMNLNYKVQPGFKVEFDGKPGQYYIIRIMNTAMTNFLVVNEKIGKPIQFINVAVEKIDSDEKGKPFNAE